MNENFVQSWFGHIGCGVEILNEFIDVATNALLESRVETTSGRCVHGRVRRAECVHESLYQVGQVAETQRWTEPV